MSHVGLKEIGICKYVGGTGGVEINLDWDNDRHHGVRIEPPFGVHEVARALRDAAEVIERDYRNLKDGKGNN